MLQLYNYVAVSTEMTMYLTTDGQTDSECSVYNCLLEEGWVVGEEVYKDNNINNRTSS